jgi:hypothetical protein
VQSVAPLPGAGCGPTQVIGNLTSS